MKCKCGNEMKFVYCDDHPMTDDDYDYAFNLYACQWCGRLCKQDVWCGAGFIWIDRFNNISKETSE